MAPHSIPWPAGSRGPKAAPPALAPPAGPRAASRSKAKAANSALLAQTSKAGSAPLPPASLKELNERRQRSPAELACACAVLNCPYQRREDCATCCERCAQAFANGEKHGEGEDYKHSKDCPAFLANVGDSRCDPRYLTIPLPDAALAPPAGPSAVNPIAWPSPMQAKLIPKTKPFLWSSKRVHIVDPIVDEPEPLAPVPGPCGSTADEKENDEAETSDRLAADENEPDDKEHASHSEHSEAEAEHSEHSEAQNEAEKSGRWTDDEDDPEDKENASHSEHSEADVMGNEPERPWQLSDRRVRSGGPGMSTSRRDPDGYLHVGPTPEEAPGATERTADENEPEDKEKNMAEVEKAKANTQGEIAESNNEATAVPAAVTPRQEHDADGDGEDASKTQEEVREGDAATAQTSPAEESVRRAAGTAASSDNPRAPKTGLRALSRGRRVRPPEEEPPAPAEILNVPLSYARCVPIFVGDPRETICDHLLRTCASLRRGEPVESSDDPRGSTAALIAPAQVLILVCFQGRAAAGEIYERLREPIQDFVCKLYTSQHPMRHGVPTHLLAQLNTALQLGCWHGYDLLELCPPGASMLDEPVMGDFELACDRFSEDKVVLAMKDAAIQDRSRVLTWAKIWYDWGFFEETAEAETIDIFYLAAVATHTSAHHTRAIFCEVDLTQQSFPAKALVLESPAADPMGIMAPGVWPEECLNDLVENYMASMKPSRRTYNMVVDSRYANDGRMPGMAMRRVSRDGEHLGLHHGATFLCFEGRPMAEHACDPGEWKHEFDARKQGGLRPEYEKQERYRTEAAATAEPGKNDHKVKVRLRGADGHMTAMTVNELRDRGGKHEGESVLASKSSKRRLRQRATEATARQRLQAAPPARPVLPPEGSAPPPAAEAALSAVPPVQVRPRKPAAGSRADTRPGSTGRSGASSSSAAAASGSGPCAAASSSSAAVAPGSGPCAAVRSTTPTQRLWRGSRELHHTGSCQQQYPWHKPSWKTCPCCTYPVLCPVCRRLPSKTNPDEPPEWPDHETWKSQWTWSGERWSWSGP